MTITLKALKKLKQEQEKITCLTCYDAAFAKLMDSLGVEVLLVGDTLGQVFQGQTSTVPVTMQDMCYHIAAVARGNDHALIIGDMPFMSYTTLEQTYQNATALLQAGAQVVKMEGGEWLCDTVYQLSQRGIAVCPHIGLQPQSVHKIGGYAKQGKTEEQAEQLFRAALALEQAGADLLVLECIPDQLATRISQALQIPTIGIGAGQGCDGQVLVIYDIIGMRQALSASFIKEFLSLCPDNSIAGRIQSFVHLVKSKEYPLVRE